VRERGGQAAVDEIFGGRTYTMLEAHPDADFTQLLQRTEHWSGLDGGTVCLELGIFTGEHTFPRLYPAFYELARDTRTFLAGVETRIHELVRATIPNARPPALTVRPAGNGSLEIDYSSARRLCRLLEGLVTGTARYFGEDLRIEQVACMRDGAETCRFLVADGGP
jgi:hypothetical protein